MQLSGSNNVNQYMSYEAYQSEKAARKTGNSEMNQQDFLNLLIVQMQNQDPLDPMDSADFTSQTTAFSQLEQLMNMNTNMEALIALQEQNTQVDQALMNSASFIGRSIEYDTNTLTISNTGASPISFYASGACSKASVNIYNSEGNLVAMVEVQNVVKGANAYPWDGSGLGGVELGEGSYYFEVNASDSSGVAIEFGTYGEGIVTGVKISNGKLYFEVENGLVPAENVYAVKDVDGDDSKGSDD